MLPAIRQLIDGNIPHPELFVEPFCGGASVSLGLLELDAVQRVLLADLDPLVAAFWQEATRDADGLIKEIRSLDVTVEQWDYWRRARPRSIRQLAVKCLFLNRTTFSGILGGHAGPIGGRTQSSGYTIDCRFNKDALAERILNVKRLHDEGRIAGVLSSGWQQTMHRARRYAALNDNPAATVFYLDPPYINKADQIYTLPFTGRDHRETRRPPQGQPAPLGPVLRRGTAHPRPVPRPFRRAPLPRHASLHDDRDTEEARARSGDHLHQPTYRPHSRYGLQPLSFRDAIDVGARRRVAPRSTTGWLTCGIGAERSTRIYLGESSHGVLRSRNSGCPTDSACISSMALSASGGICLASPSRASASEVK